MESLLREIKNLQNSEIKGTIDKRLSEFSSFKGKCGDDWFSELCFCILTANSRASTAINIQNQLGANGFLSMPQPELSEFIKSNKHRFHNNKSKYIEAARVHRDVRDKISSLSEVEARDWIVKNVKGIGFKEASHFLRNTGSLGVAILDRHIINLMHEVGLIEKPKTLTSKNYTEIEYVFNEIAKQVDMSSAELDLYMWYIKTGSILK